MTKPIGAPISGRRAFAPAQSESAQSNPTRSTTVDWSRYARVYDMLLAYNPAYIALRDLFAEFVAQEVAEVPLDAVDIGAGTGVFAEVLADLRPAARLTLIEPDPEMAAIASRRLAGRAEVTRSPFEAVEDAPRYDLIFSTHALYTMPDQEARLAQMARMCRPGGRLFLIDFGKRMNVLDWRIYLLSRLLLRHGPVETARLAWRGRAIASENARVAQLQDEGVYWRHDAPTLAAVVEANGWRVDRFETTYRGYSSLITARRAEP